MQDFHLHSADPAFAARSHGTAPPDYLRFRTADLDTGADPLRDFNAHVNGRWQRSHGLPGTRHDWDALTVLQEHARHEQAQVITSLAVRTDLRDDPAATVVALWRSAQHFLADAPRIPPALDLELRRIARLDHATQLRRYVIERHARGWPVLFQFDVEPDFGQPTQPIACMQPAGLGLPDPDFYAGTDPLAGRWRAAYQRYVQAVFRMLGDTPTQALAGAAAVTGIEARLAAATPARASVAADITLQQRRVTVTEADGDSRHFSWREFLLAQGARAPTHLSLPHPAFHACWQNLLHSLPTQAWRSYLRFHAVDSLADALHDDVAALREAFHAEPRGGVPGTARWQRVLRQIDQHAPENLGHCYLQNVGRDTTAVSQLCESLRAGLRLHIGACHWLGTAARNAAIAKLDALRFRIGGDSGALPHPLLSRRDWVDNLLTLRASRHRQRVQRLQAPVDATIWRLPPHRPNACYDPQANAVEIPAALLRPPFFHGPGERVLNQGGLGAAIAHEMMHAFDRQGSRFDAAGALGGGWKLGDHLRFEQRGAALRVFLDTTVGAAGQAPGSGSAAENMADMTGVAVAFRTLPAGTSADAARHFFYNWATCWRQQLCPEEIAHRRWFDPHAPGPVRVNAPVAALPEAALLFGARRAGAGFSFW